MDEAITDAAIDRLRLLAYRNSDSVWSHCFGRSNQLESADQPPLLLSSKLDV